MQPNEDRLTYSNVLSLEGWLTWPAWFHVRGKLKPAMPLNCNCMSCGSVAIIIAHFCLRQATAIAFRFHSRLVPIWSHSRGADTHNWSLVSPRAIPLWGQILSAGRCSHFGRLRFEILMSNYRHVKLNHEIITESLT